MGRLAGLFLLSVATVVLLGLWPVGCGTSSTTSTQAPSGSSPVQRALLALVAYSRYAFAVTTWDMSEADHPVLFQVDGVSVDPWTYMKITGPGLAQPVELAYDSQQARARVDGGPWRPAEDVFSATEGLDAALLENPEPVKDLIPNIAQEARPVTDSPPLPAAAPPGDAAQSYAWEIPLTEGATKVAVVRNQIWLDGNGVLVRWDRQLIPERVYESGLTPSYSTITYSRQGDSSLTIPAEGYNTATSSNATSSATIGTTRDAGTNSRTGNRTGGRNAGATGDSRGSTG